MAVTIIPDTHRFVQRLTAAGMPSGQAEALKDELTNNVAELVTRDYLDSRLVRLELRMYGAQIVSTGIVLGVIAKAHGWL